MKIDHVGSTAIPGLKAKPTIDILLQISEQIEIQKLKDTFKSLGYLINDHPENPAPHLTFVKGYTAQGFKGQAYHVHIRYIGDWDEVRFRDYLIKNKEIADGEHNNHIFYIRQVHEYDKVLNGIKRKYRKAKREKSETLAKQQAEDIYERFKNGEKLSTEDLMCLQKAGYL